jgi:C4-dicarboxylate-specific signal transduction histidine kinase
MNLLSNAIDALEELRSASTKSGQQTPTIWINTSVQRENVVILSGIKTGSISLTTNSHTNLG